MQDIQVLIITFVNLFLQYVWIANLLLSLSLQWRKRIHYIQSFGPLF